MLFTVPEKIRRKFHYSEDGGYLDEPYTEEEKRICDEKMIQSSRNEKPLTRRPVVFSCRNLPTGVKRKRSKQCINL